MENNTLSKLIQSRREELNLRQEDIAEELGVSRQTVSKWENGYIESMNIGRVASYSSILKLPAIAFIYPESYLDLKYIDDDYIEIARKLQNNNISIKSIENYINLISDIKLELFKELR